MNRSILSLLIVCCLLFSCQKEDDHNSTQGTISTFGVSLSPTNYLRAEVRATFSTQTSYHIAYWETANPEQVKYTDTYQAIGSTQRTLLLLKPDTDYSCQIITEAGDKSVVKTFKTKSVEAFLPNAILLKEELSEKIEGYLLANNRNSKHIYLMDMNGNVVWYEPVADTPAVVNYDPHSQRFYMLTDAPSEGLFVFNAKKLKVIDLLGNLTLEKDFSTIPELQNCHVHHECRPMPNGNIGLVTYIDKTVDLSTKGGSQSDTIRGDGFVIMNSKGEITYQWSCFDYLNPVEYPTINSKKVREDWIHANSIDQDSEGNYYMTTNRDSELWKINGRTGELIYRVGEKGTITPTTHYVSHGIHCAIVQAPDEVLVIDNARENKSTGSRALIYKVNPTTKTVSVPTEVALPKGNFSATRSNVQLIGKQSVLFALSSSKQVLITNRSTTAQIQRHLQLPYTFYRVQYISTIKY